MKRCPTCNRTFTDPILSFCTEDGTPLVPAPESLPGTGPTPSDYSRGQTPGNGKEWNPAPYQPPGSYVRPGGQTRRRALPWALGIVSLLILGVVALSIAAVIFIPRWTRQTSNTNDGRQTASNSNLNAGTSGGVDQPNSNVSHANVNAIVGLPNSNSNDNGNANTNANSNAGSEAGAPSDKDQVLVQLTDLEHEWTVANLNADKKALARILADDYVGSSPTGMQGKADYIKNIQRDTSVERWDFEDLNVTLHGDRATLSGKVKLVIKGEERVFNFVDKFVWREGRWQATGSEVNLVQ